MIESDAPYLIEETYFYRVISRQRLQDMCQRFIGAVAGVDAPRLEHTLASLIVRLDELDVYPISHGPNIMSEQMVNRGHLAENIYRLFVDRVSQQSHDFYSLTRQVDTPSRPSKPGVTALYHTSNIPSNPRIGMKDVYGVAHLKNPNLQRVKRQADQTSRTTMSKKIKLVHQIAALIEETVGSSDEEDDEQ